MAPAVEGGRNVVGDQATEGVAHDGAAPARVQAARFIAEELRDVGPGGEKALVEVEVVGDLAYEARAHCHRRRRGLRLSARRRHADLVERQLETSVDGPQDFGGATLGQVAPVDAPG